MLSILLLLLLMKYEKESLTLVAQWLGQSIQKWTQLIL